MKRTWYCAAYGVKFSIKHPHDAFAESSLEIRVFPFGVLAEEVWDARDMADSVARDLQSSNPGFDHWEVKINDDPDSALVTQA